MRRHRHRRRLIAAGVLGALLVLALAAIVVISWMFSSELIVPDHDPGPFDVRVERVQGPLVTFERDETSVRRGVYGLQWDDGGHAITRGITEAGDDGVTRRVTDREGALGDGDEVAFWPSVWEGDPQTARGIPFREVRYPDELGPMPAWQVDGRGDTWAIFVHGHNAERQEGLRILPALHAAGLPALVISYRNDAGAPPARDHLLHLGQTEWRDLDAAARYAIARGARRFVLVGNSMGGAIVSQFVHESPLASRITALILDSPVLDWDAVVRFQASERSLPQFLGTTVRWTVSARIGFDWGAFDQIKRADEFHMPILLFHGTQDETVPISSSDAFARALPQLVTYFRVPGAGHTESWNVDPPLYDRRVREFLARVLP